MIDPSQTNLASAPTDSPEPAPMDAGAEPPRDLLVSGGEDSGESAAARASEESPRFAVRDDAGEPDEPAVLESAHTEADARRLFDGGIKSNVLALDPDPPLVGNPFPVYPVASLRDITDIRAATVSTPEVKVVLSVVEAYIEGFDATSADSPRHLVLAAKGDFGSGKTHLMRYARSVLEHQSHQPVSLSVAGNEAAIEDWYASVLGPALAAMRPREVIRDLMVDVACEVAERDPYTRHLAARFKDSVQEMFDALRSADEIDASEVERLFESTVQGLCPQPDAGIPRVLLALPNAQTSQLAERWLAGESLSEEDRQRIGAPNAADRATSAMVALCAIAGACRRLKRPFALFVDELEHLVRYDRRNRSRRNLTWIKRLVESLVGTGAMVFICGHWEAWEQQGDFLDRFMGRPTIQLVRLTDSDVLDIVKVCAPGWTRYFSPLIARAVIEATAGNIRRVMTVLYDLYADERNRTSDIPTSAVNQAALRRLEGGTIGGILPAIESAARACHATVERDAELFGESFDATLRLDEDLRLLVKIIHGRDEGRLLAEGERFADSVRLARTDFPRVRGMFVALGAVNSNHLRTLDAARSEMDVLNAEAPDATEQAVRLTTAALRSHADGIKGQAPDSGPKSLDSDLHAPRQQLSSLRSDINAQALAQGVRAQTILGDSDRGRTVYGSVAEDDNALLEQKYEINEREEVERILSRERNAMGAEYLHSLLGRPLTLLGVMVASGVGLFPKYPVLLLSPFENGPIDNVVAGVVQFTSLGVIAGFFITELSRLSSMQRFWQYRLRVLDDMRAQGARLRDLIEARSVIERVAEKHHNPKSAPREIDAELEFLGLLPFNKRRKEAKRKK